MGEREDIHMGGMRYILKAVAVALLLTLLLCGGALAAGFSDTPADMEQAAQSVVKLTVYDSQGRGLCTGSGFFLFDGSTIVTNYHVIENGYYVVAETDAGDSLDVDYVLVCS